jgi:hypothetical protein
MRDEVFEHPCPICNAKPHEPCRDENIQPMSFSAHHVGRATGGASITIVKNPDGTFREIDN